MACELEKSNNQLVKNGYQEFIKNLADWSKFITLTFRQDINELAAQKAVIRLIRILNAELLGSHYKNYIRHSYFSYVVSMEYQLRGVPHFHMLADKDINYQLVHEYWNRYHGFAIVKDIRNSEAREKIVDYCIKYIMKDSFSNLFYFKCEVENFTPKNKPVWWINK